MKEFFIWSFEHDAWRRAEGKGYTNDILQAGLYTKQEAEAICDGLKSRDETMMNARGALSVARLDADYQLQLARRRIELFDSALKHLERKRRAAAQPSGESGQ